MSAVAEAVAVAASPLPKPLYILERRNGVLDLCIGDGGTEAEAEAADADTLGAAEGAERRSDLET